MVRTGISRPTPPPRRVAKLFRVSTTDYSCETIGYGASGSGQLRVGIKEETWSITPNRSSAVPELASASSPQTSG